MQAEEIKRAAKLLLDKARDGGDIHRQTITRALRITGDLPFDAEDEEDGQPDHETRGNP